MHFLYSLAVRCWSACLAVGLLVPIAGKAQAPAWSVATSGSTTQTSGISTAQATAVGANGDVFVTGYFSGTVAFGGTVLTSAGADDLFVAKYVPSTSTWAWATRGGGISFDQGLGIALNGTSVYVTGYLTTNVANGNAVVLEGTGSTPGTMPISGASPFLTHDLFVAKYTDNGNSTTLGWTQVGGGVSDDQGNGIAVSGSSVYVTGFVVNNQSNVNSVVFGGTGSAIGTVQVNGATTTTSRDLLLVKYTDNGSTAVVGWTQVGGGTSNDGGQAVVATGTSVYVTGSIINSRADGSGVLFGGSGTTPGSVPQYGASATSTIDMVVAKYSDNGTSAALNWTQVAGGTGNDYGYGIATNGTNVYVAGALTNSTANASGVLFGGTGTGAGTFSQVGATATNSSDLFVAKYSDGGSSATVSWAQVGGGTGTDAGRALAVRGASIYVAGYLVNNVANSNAAVFGGTAAQAGASATSSSDFLLAKYTDQGSTATLGWTQIGGGTADDQALSLATTATGVAVAGYVGASASATFGTAAGSPLLGNAGNRAVLSLVSDAGTAGTWQAVATPATGGASLTRATAVDAAGNVFVTGNFSGQVAFGTTVLSSAGTYDLFVAKYVPSTGTWAWAQSGGGTGNDQGLGIAVIGNTVYVTGFITNTNTNTNAVLFGGTGPTTGSMPQYGASTANGNDVFVAKYTDNGNSATLGWTQVGGGGSGDFGNGIAVSGTSVYVTGSITNDAANTFGVLFGGSGATAGTARQYGASSLAGNDLFVAKYTDNGNSATFGWTQVGGGTGSDQGVGIAASGTSVYVVGSLTNSTANTSAVHFGGSGTTAGTLGQYGASSTTSSDVLLAKYTDQGSSATLGWTQVGGGSSSDFGQAVAVNGSSVYLTGVINNSLTNSNNILFGGAGTTAGTVVQNGASTSASQDIVVAKYTDQGSSATLGWTQVGGGTDSDQGLGIAVSGTTVFVSGILVNNTSNANAVAFGGAGTTPGTATQVGASASSSSDILVARYTDQGSTAALNWTQVGGGPSEDYDYSIAASSGGVYVAGLVIPTATFSSFTLSNPPGLVVNFLGGFGPVALPVRQPAATAAVRISVFPNPTTTYAILKGAAPNAVVRIIDVLGRLLLTATTDAEGTATLLLPPGMPGGMYFVQTGAGTTHLVIE